MAPEKKKLTAAERKKIEEQIAALQESLEDQEEASGAEQRAADAEVEAERKKLADLFDRLGIGEEDWTLISTAFATGTEARTRAIVREELAAEEEAQDEQKKGGSLGELEGNPGAPPVPPDSPPQEPPTSRHWTEKKLFGKRDEPDDS